MTVFDYSVVAKDYLALFIMLLIAMVLTVIIFFV